MSSQIDPRTFYRVPRESVDVEALAQEHFYYLRICAEDTEYLNTDPTLRNKLIAEFNAHPDVKPKLVADAFVAIGESPEVHLVPANAKIRELTPPKSFKDRVIRMHIATAAFMVFHQYKLTLPLLEYDDLRRKIEMRTDVLLRKWIKEELLPCFPERLGQRASATVLSTPPRAPTSGLASPTPSSSSAGYGPHRMDKDEATEFLKSPHILVGRKFVRDLPPNEGGWEVAAFNARMVDGRVDYEYQVMFDAFGEDLIPMDTESIHDLLQVSRPVVI